MKGEGRKGQPAGVHATPPGADLSNPGRLHGPRPRGENPETFAASQSERQKQERLVLYDPGDPATGVLLDDLPGRLSVGLGGVLEASSLRPIWALLLALLALVGTLASVLVVA